MLWYKTPGPQDFSRVRAFGSHSIRKANPMIGIFLFLKTYIKYIRIIVAMKSKLVPYSYSSILIVVVVVIVF